MRVKRNKVVWTFTGSGLVAKGDLLCGFAIAGKNQGFVWAEAKIEGDMVIVGSDQSGIQRRYDMAGRLTQ